MKHIITITFLMTCLGSKFTYGNDDSPTCQPQVTIADIATYLMEACEIPLDITKVQLEKVIAINDDIDGPGYKKLSFLFHDEYIGSQILIDYKNEQEVCYTENNLEHFCPKDYSN